MVDTKDQSNAIVYGIFFVDTVDMKIKACNALNAMYVETVDTLVFVALTQHLIQSTLRCENYSTLYKVASCPCYMSRLSIQGSSSIQHVLLKTERKTGICRHCQHMLHATR